MPFSFADMADFAGAFLPNPNSKPLIKSKTLIFNALVAVAACYPPAAQWMAGHAALVTLNIGLANIALRLVTHSRLTLFGSE